MSVGAKLFEKQVLNGMRPIVEDIDKLRILLGNENVQVLTPKVETRLRSGIVAQIPLKVQVKPIIKENTQSFILEISYYQGFPQKSLEISLFGDYVNSKGLIIKISQDFIDKLNSYCQSKVDKCNYISAIHLIEYTRILIKQLRKEIRKSNTNANKSSEEESNDGDEDDNDLNDNDDNKLNEEIVVKSNQIIYATCKICRNKVFTIDELIPHSLEGFTTSKSFSSNKCKSLFLVNAPKWLQIPIDSTNTGKLNCIQCGCRLGHWSWIGSPCSCGLWISPSFQISICKIDQKIETI